jgi:uncharacterized protein (UPF0261 family)
MAKLVYAIATMDTKGHEITFVAKLIRKDGLAVAIVDVGTTPNHVAPADISSQQVAMAHPGAAARTAIFDCGNRGQAVAWMSEALEQFLVGECEKDRVAGVIGIGGSGGTSLISRAMRALPLGLPKVLVSTVASGNTAPYVGSSDITMMYSVVDVSGLNNVSRKILANAAHALTGMVSHQAPPQSDRPTLGMTMFGVTTACVDQVRTELERQGFDCLVFHATGAGGRAMEKMVASDLIQGVLDVTTTEVADELVGGVFSCGPERFDVIFEKRIPYVMSLGALDMVNFGAMETVPAEFRDRLLYVHNPQVTLMRTTVVENQRIAKWIAEKVNRSNSPVSILIPEKGVSAIDAVDKPFWSPEADAMLFNTLEASIAASPERRVIRLPYHINDPEFSAALVTEYLRLLNLN